MPAGVCVSSGETAQGRMFTAAIKGIRVVLDCIRAGFGTAQQRCTAMLAAFSNGPLVVVGPHYRPVGL